MFYDLNMKNLFLRFFTFIYERYLKKNKNKLKIYNMEKEEKL